MAENRRFTRRGLLALIGCGLGPGLAGCQGDDEADRTTSTTETSPTAATATEENPSTERNPFQPGTADWPQFQYDARNTGSHPDSTGPGGVLEERWSFHIGAESMVSIVDSVVFSTVSAGRITALDLHDGETVWTSPDAGYTSAIESVSGRLFTTRGNWLVEVDSETGSAIDRTEFPSSIVTNGFASVGQSLYIGTNEGGLYAFDITNDEVRWRYDTGAKPHLHVTDRTVFVGKSREGGGLLHAIDRREGTLRWEFVTAEPSPGIPAPPTTGPDTVYVGNDGGHVYAIDRDTGTEQWHTQVQGPVHTQPTLENGRLYLGLRGFPRGFVEALDTDTGDSEWRVMFDGTGWASAEVWASPQLVGETLIVGTDSGHVYGLDLEDGGQIWEFATGNKIRSLSPTADGVVLGNFDADTYRITLEGTDEWHHVGESIPIWSSPIVGDGTVFVGGTDAKLHAIDEASGELVWSMQTEQPVVAGSVFADGSVYLQATKTGAFDADTGDIEWSFRPKAGGPTSPVLEDGVLYACETSEIVDWTIYAVDVSDGEMLWDRSTDSRLLASPAVADGVVCTGSRAGVLYGFDAASGETLWESLTGASVEAGPVIDDGLVYVGSRAGTLHAVGLDDGSERWTHAVNEPIRRSAALDGGTLYVPAGQSLLALDITTQEERWRVPLAGGTAPAVCDGILYMGDRSGRVQAFDTDTGDAITAFDTGDGPIKAPVVAVNGSVYVGGADGLVYALDAGLQS